MSETHALFLPQVKEKAYRHDSDPYGCFVVYWLDNTFNTYEFPGAAEVKQLPDPQNNSLAVAVAFYDAATDRSYQH